MVITHKLVRACRGSRSLDSSPGLLCCVDDAKVLNDFVGKRPESHYPHHLATVSHISRSAPMYTQLSEAYLIFEMSAAMSPERPARPSCLCRLAISSCARAVRRWREHESGSELEDMLCRQRYRRMLLTGLLWGRRDRLNRPFLRRLRVRPVSLRLPGRHRLRFCCSELIVILIVILCHGQVR